MLVAARVDVGVANDYVRAAIARLMVNAVAAVAFWEVMFENE